MRLTKLGFELVANHLQYTFSFLSHFSINFMNSYAFFRFIKYHRMMWKLLSPPLWGCLRSGVLENFSSMYRTTMKTIQNLQKAWTLTKLQRKNSFRTISLAFPILCVFVCVNISIKMFSDFFHFNAFLNLLVIHTSSLHIRLHLKPDV